MDAQHRREDGSSAPAAFSPATVLTPSEGTQPAGSQGLLEAIVAVGSDLDLPTVLRQVVESAVSLVEARYGALGVRGESAALSQFITVGVDADHRALIGTHPEGRGILGLLLRDPEPMRLGHLTRHPEAAGFPPHHPTMSSFLGVPILVRGEIFGNLYLAEKTGDREFDDADERVVVALAGAAGVAIENARMYDEVRQRERWLRASAEVMTSLLSGTDPSDALLVVARRARELTDADVAIIALPTHGDELVIEVADGRDPERLIGLLLPTAGSLVGAAFRTAEPMTVIELDPAGPVGAALGPDRLGTIVMVPLGTAPAFAGVLGVVIARGTELSPDRSGLMLQAFAEQAAVALELARARRDSERVLVFEDRDRIARDLHDRVIQRLFAAGMQLQSSLRLIASPEAVTRLHAVVDDLDSTISEIRSTIYALHSSPTPIAGSTRSRLLGVSHEAARTLGFEPSLHFDGPVDASVPSEVGDHMVAVLREAMSNVVRHAHARAVSIRVSVREGSATIAVRDDGVGLPDSRRGIGLTDLHERAAILGGAFSATRDSESGGTSLSWSVPLPDA